MSATTRTTDVSATLAGLGQLLSIGDSVTERTRLPGKTQQKVMIA
ncbi:hypothetical protein [Rhodococcus maanshanensis]|uniref:Uncharacterized protein n=1 Tax=Rhodococcus maanshanensis TaxID=183556 RepID=A0A1H7R541_9NOCA|nr:hypothetical protein [Rhodococcus maanshanensis]SEL55045.1 hypothetical protein SAMN05444583_110144 [Rhodococcus maanshanensis]